MTNVEILNTILSIPGAQMCRVNKTNFVAIPTDDGYAKVSVGTALAKDTKVHTAFNFDAAVAEFKAYEAEVALRAAEKASKPKAVKGPNPEAQARRDAMDKAITELPAFADYTATDITRALEATGFLPAQSVPMQVGQSAKRLVESGVLTEVLKGEGNKKKSYYTKA